MSTQVFSRAGAPHDRARRPWSARAPGTRGRAFALLAAAAFPALMDAMHRTALGLPLGVPALVETTANAIVLLAVVAAVFEGAVRRRVTGAACFALTGVTALVVGTGESFGAWALAGHLGLPATPPGHDDAVVVARMGAADGVLGLGLFAMAVALPFAASGAREADRLRATAELVRLRANLQPHFLFNTLSTISGLVVEEPGEARRLIATLADLLRDSLLDADEMQTLDDEVRWLGHYAKILETRHRGAISFEWRIDETARRARIPRLLLQPLVENAVKHGALRRPEGGAVAIRATVDGDRRITCVVEDNGPGPAAGVARPGAIGIELVERRLSLRYGDAAHLRIERADGRTRSIVSLPSEPAS